MKIEYGFTCITDSKTTGYGGRAVGGGSSVAGVPDPNARKSICKSIPGDSFKTKYEDCDDGNSNNGDGCSSSMKIETGWACTEDSKSKSSCTK